MIFSIKNITKKYGKNVVINKFSYTFSNGLYLLTGINGVGKSTLLKIIAKVIYPSKLNYFIDEEKVAYLCEKIELLNSNVLSYLKVISKINNKKENLKELTNKWNIPNKNITSLSNGNKQKVAILSMYLAEANVYLFDEPTNALDDNGINLFLEFVNDLISNDKIVIISTHEKEHFTIFKYEEINLKCST